MDIRILEYFLMVASEENITRAAKLLHITQPTLSRQLRQLEDELGAKLFVRSNHNVILTDEGFLFRRRAQDIVSIADKAKNEITQIDDTLSGMISIGCGELNSVKELAKLMASFQCLYPQVKFELYSGRNEDLREKIEAGTLDMALFLEPFNATKYEIIPMHTREQWGVLVHEDSPLSKQSAIYPGDLVGNLVVTVHVNTPVQMELIKWAGDFAKEMDFSVNYNVLHNAVIVARELKGAVICINLDSHYNNMRFLPLEPKLELESILAWKNRQNESKATKAFMQYVMQSYKNR